MIRRPSLLWAMLSGALIILTNGVATADDQPPAATAPPVATEGTTTITPGVQFETDFAAANGATLTTTNGHNEQREGSLSGMFAAYASVPEGQSKPLVLKVTEDQSVNGPDGQPGVLRLQYADVPNESQYSGFLMYGDEESGKMTLPGLTLGKVTLNDLRRTFIEFKFRADNPENDERFGTTAQFRIEPEHKDSYGRRADFGVLIATPRWRTFRRPIQSANNIDWFLTTVNEDNPPHFKLVWGQNGSIQTYAPGDSLLIDDVKIVVE